jgi:hypothetical protein
MIDSLSSRVAPRARVSTLALFACVSVASFTGLGCSSAPDGSSAAPSSGAAEPNGTPQTVGQTGAASEALSFAGSRETVVDGVAAAENLMFSDTGRLFVTGDDGIYELTRDASDDVTKTVVAPATTCKFAGMSEIGGVLYAACYDQTGSNSYLYAAELDPVPQFRSIYTLSGVALANGVAADSQGRLYVADSFDGTLLRLGLAPTDPFAVATKETFVAKGSNILPNGLKFFGGAIYYTDFVSIKRVPLLPDGSAGPIATLDTQLTFFDDLYVDARRILVANFLFGTVELLTPGGIDLFDTAAFTFEGPSAVIPAAGRLGFSENDLLITEKSGNRVAVFHPAF